MLEKAWRVCLTTEKKKKVFWSKMQCDIRAWKWLIRENSICERCFVSGKGSQPSAMRTLHSKLTRCCCWDTNYVQLSGLHTDAKIIVSRKKPIMFFVVFVLKIFLKDNQLDLTNSDCWNFRYLLNVFLLRTRTMDFAPISAMNISFNVHTVWACEYCITDFEKCEPILLSTLINVGCKMEASGVLWELRWPELILLSLVTFACR